MSWIIVITLLIASVVAIGVTGFIVSDRVAAIVGYPALAIGIITLVALVGMSFRSAARTYDTRVCDSFGDETGHTVKFADYNYWTWECLVLDPRDGTWLPRDQFRNIGS